MIDDTLFEAEEKMDKAVTVAREDFSIIRTGRAHPATQIAYAGLEQPADGFATLCAQLTVLRGGAAAERWPSERWSSQLLPRWPPGPAWRGGGGAGSCLLVHSKSVAFRTVVAGHSVDSVSRGGEPLADLPGDELVGGDLLGDGRGDHDRASFVSISGGLMAERDAG